jgi:hypothetical protein
MSVTPEQINMFGQAFDQEYFEFLRCRGSLRRYMPTPDQFPLFCELVTVSKKLYVSTPRGIRIATRHISFEHFDRNWSIRMNRDMAPRAGEVYIDLCCAESKKVLVTVAVQFGNDRLEVMQS